MVIIVQTRSDHPLGKLAVIIQDMILHDCTIEQIFRMVQLRCNKARNNIHQNQNRENLSISGGGGVSSRGAGR